MQRVRAAYRSGWLHRHLHPEGGLTRDAILDNITLYWVTNTGTSAARLYWENARVANKGEISVPAAFIVFPGELWRAQRSCDSPRVRS